MGETIADSGVDGAFTSLGTYSSERLGITETRTDFEEVLLSIVDSACIRRPVCDYPIDVGEEVPISVDFAWIPERVVLEFESWRFHSDPIAQARDLRRYRALTLADWIVLPDSRA